MAYNELIGTLGEQSAAWYKEECRQYAEQAQQSATNAENSATSAERDAGIASDKADIATNKANLAGESADLAQEWAIKTDGKVGGIDFSSKQYAINAGESATTAGNKADEASASATLAEKWASYTNGTVDGTNYSAKQYALNAGNSATTASTKAGEASDSAQTASDKAGIATTQAGLASGSALSASNSATLAENWATKTDGTVDGTNYSAKQYALNAGNSATNAGTSETNAGNSATLAEKWATLMGDTVDGNEYSSKYYANEADGYATSASNSASSAQSNADYIQTEAVKIDTTEKRVSNIEKLLQGNLYDYQTDSTSAYTKTVPAGAMPYASLDKVGGKTVVWNQLVSSSTFPTAHSENGGTTTWSGDTVVYGGTTTSVSWLYVAVSSTIPANNHKYLAMTDNIPSGFRFGLLRGNGTFDYLGNDIPYFFYTNTLGINAVNYRIPADTVVDFTAHLMLFDLTLMFGAGNEPTTIAEFTAQFPAPYYAFNNGQLLSAGVTEVKSVGKNLWNLANRTLGDAGEYSNTTPRNWNVSEYYYSFTRNNYYYKNYGTFASVTDGFEFTPTYNYSGVILPFKANAGETYTLTCNYSGAGFGVGYAYYDGNGNFISFDSPANAGTSPNFKSSCTTPANTYWVAVVMIGNANTKFTVTNVQFEKSATATAYSPYKEISYPIPASIQALEGYGWSADIVPNGTGTYIPCYNYVDYENKKFVQKVFRHTFNGQTDDVINIVSLTTSASNITFLSFRVKSAYVHKTGNNGDNYNIVADRFQRRSFENISYGTYNNCYAIQGNWNVAFALRIEGYTTLEEYQTYLSNNPLTLQWELATPIEVDISAYLTDDNLIEVEPNGTLTFPNSNGDDYRIPVPSAETYMIDLQASL